MRLGRLSHPRLPCLNVGRATKEIWMPLELCAIAKGQRRLKLSSDEQASQPPQSCCTPRSSLPVLKHHVRSAGAVWTAAAHAGEALGWRSPGRQACYRRAWRCVSHSSATDVHGSLEQWWVALCSPAGHARHSCPCISRLQRAMHACGRAVCCSMPCRLAGGMPHTMWPA